MRLDGTPIVIVEGLGEQNSAIGSRASKPTISTLRLMPAGKPRRTHKAYNASDKKMEGFNKGLLLMVLSRMLQFPWMIVSNI
jgi:hypothetical protein